MNIGSLTATGLDGLRKSLDGANRAAAEISNLSTLNSDNSSVEGPTTASEVIGSEDTTVNLAKSVVDLNMNQQLFEASAKVVKVADNMLGTILDTKA